MSAATQTVAEEFQAWRLELQGAPELLDPWMVHAPEAADIAQRWLDLSETYGDDAHEALGDLEDYVLRMRRRAAREAAERAWWTEEREARQEREYVDFVAEQDRLMHERAPEYMATSVERANAVQAQRHKLAEGASDVVDRHFADLLREAREMLAETEAGGPEFEAAASAIREGVENLSRIDRQSNEWFEEWGRYMRENVVPLEREAAAHLKDAERWAKIAGTERPQTKIESDRERAERAREAARERVATEEREKAIADALRKIEVAEEAKRRHAANKAGAITFPEVFTLDGFLEEPLAAEAFVIDGLMHTGGNVMFSAQRKAGKTVMTHNLVRSLVDGDPFMDTFSVATTRKVALLDFELSTSLLQSWLRQQAIRNTANLLVVPMRGKAASFNILDDRTRARWAEQLRGYDVLILDPLRPVLDALRLNEWNETGPLLQAFDALKVEAGISEGLIIQHHGHHAERAAGDSRLEGWPDAIWSLTRDDVTDPRSFRYFDAYGRDVDVDKGLVSMYGEKRLAFAADASAAKADQVGERIGEWLQQNGESKKADILAAGIRGVNDKSFTRVMDKALEAGLVSVRTGEKNAKFYTRAAA